jgi:hypothetical protein
MDTTRRNAGSSIQANACSQSTQSLVDICARVVREQGFIRRLSPSVRLPDHPYGIIPKTLLIKVLGPISHDALRRFESVNSNFDTADVWRGLCSRDFGMDVAEDGLFLKNKTQWRDHYDCLKRTHHQMESQTKRTLREGVLFVNTRAEVKKVQRDINPPPPSMNARTPLPLLQRRSTVPQYRTQTSSSHSNVFRRSGQQSTSATKEHLRSKAEFAQLKLKRDRAMAEQGSGSIFSPFASTGAHHKLQRNS